MLISGRYKKVLLRINDEGVAFYQKVYFYEYEWEEIEYLRQSIISGQHVIMIKALGRSQEYKVDISGCFWTFIPVRVAVYHYSKGRTKYYTRRQWKMHNNSINSNQ